MVIFMNFQEKLDRLDGVFAYDSGCLSSGIKDDEFKNKIKQDHEQLNLLLTALARRYLNSDGYTIEDIQKLLQWASCELEFIL